MNEELTWKWSLPHNCIILYILIIYLFFLLAHTSQIPKTLKGVDAVQSGWLSVDVCSLQLDLLHAVSPHISIHLFPSSFIMQVSMPLPLFLSLLLHHVLVVIVIFIILRATILYSCFCVSLILLVWPFTPGMIWAAFLDKT